MIERNATKGIRNKPFKKLRYREKMLNFLSDPENDIPSRTTLACTVLKMKYSTKLYRYFSCAELNEILDEALGVRRKRYAAEAVAIERARASRSARTSSHRWQPVRVYSLTAIIRPKPLQVSQAPKGLLKEKRLGEGVR